LHSLDVLFLKVTVYYVNLIMFIQILSNCYWTKCPPLTLLIRQSPESIAHT